MAKVKAKPKVKVRAHKKLSDQLRELIARSGISRYAICKSTMINESALSKFCHGKRGLSSKTLDRLGEFYDLEIRRKKRRRVAKRK